MPSDLLFELGCEELPSGSVWPLAHEFANNMQAQLAKAQLAHGAVTIYATPRRIGLFIEAVQSEQASQKNQRKGPAVIAAYDKQGNPTPALLGFAKSCNVAVDQLQTLKTDKGDFIVYDSESAAVPTQELLPAMIKQSLSSLPITKPMRWGAGEEEFARPVHWAVILFDGAVINADILGVKSGNQTMGHRFHNPQRLEIQSPQTYEQQLFKARVVVDFAQRKQMIRDQVLALAQKINAKAIMPDELLDEVTSIVEWPQALMANFEKEFLQVPAEALIASMQTHQKCFALQDEKGNLLPHFITVSNIESTNPQQVIAGNEKVMRARLSDAAFFFKQDKKQALAAQIPATEQVVFQAKLGTLKDKTNRMGALMEHLANAMNLNATKAARAAVLSKCDLLTGMVGEFPELQGLMGYYYALNDKEDSEVAVSLNEQYMPRFAADALPNSNLGTALSLADRIDTLVGIFAIGQKPTGVKDPFKLRRHALAIVRMLIANPAELHLSTLIAEAKEQFGDKISADNKELQELKPFILDRLNAYYQNQGIAQELVAAARARQDECLYDLDRRIQALSVFVTLPEAQSLAAACKRVRNILNQAGFVNGSQAVNPSLLEEGMERTLFQRMQEVNTTITPLYAAADYTNLLKQLASLKEPVDNYFDKVMVLVDNPDLKNNRLTLLAHLQNLAQGVADISLL